MNGTAMFFRLLERVVRHSANAGTALAFPLFALVALVGSSTVIANHEPTNTQACQAQFEIERAMCNSLTGQARAACQRQAAERFRMCRGQASPTALTSAPGADNGAGGAPTTPDVTRVPNSRSSPKWLLRLQQTRS